MERTGGSRATSRSRLLGRLGVLALAIGGLVITVAPGMAGAAANSTVTEISTAKNAKLGTILVAGDTAVYTLKAGKTCSASCQKTQPPVLLPDGVMSATAGTGVDQAKLGTKPAANGALQITYNGKPLYWSTKDKSSSQVKGAGTNKFGTWSAVVLPKSSSGSKSTSTSSGNGGVGF